MKDENDINNLLLSETEGATPAEHLEALASMRKDAERYRAFKEFSLLTSQDPDRAEEIAGQLPDKEVTILTEQDFDAIADALVVLMAAPKD